MLLLLSCYTGAVEASSRGTGAQVCTHRTRNPLPLNSQIALFFGTTHISVSVAKGILNGYLHCKFLRNWRKGIRAQSASHLNFVSSESNPSFFFFFKFLFQEKRIQRVEMQCLTTRLQGIRISHKKNIFLFPTKFSYIDFLYGHLFFTACSEQMGKVKFFCGICSLFCYPN